MAPKYSGLSGSKKPTHPFFPLARLPEPICATESRLVLPHPVTLIIQENKFDWIQNKPAFYVSCANTGINYFRCQKKISFTNKTILWDIAGTPVIHLKKRPWIIPTFWTYWTAFAGAKSNKELVKFSTYRNLIPFKIRVAADFLDARTGRVRHLVLKWSCWKELAVVYSGDPKHGGIPVAKMFSRTGSWNYYVEIGADVDIALVVAMCLIAIQDLF